MFKKFNIIALLVLFVSPVVFAKEGEMSLKATKGRANACLGKSIASSKYSFGIKQDKNAKDSKVSVAN
jgi:hypothetical protein